jgi:hypothetical protein
MKLALALLLSLHGACAIAETWLTASLGSYHFDRNGYCEVNPGVGMEHSIGLDVRLIAGSYQNSYCRPSSYLGASWMPVRFLGVRFGAAVAGVTGYAIDKSSKKDRMAWAALPVLAWEGKRRGVNLVLLPPHEEFKGGVGLQLKLRFD